MADWAPVQSAPGHQQKERTYLTLVDMFVDVVEPDIIQMILQNRNWDLDAALEDIMILSSTSQSDKARQISVKSGGKGAKTMSVSKSDYLKNNSSSTVLQNEHLSFDSSKEFESEKTVSYSSTNGGIRSAKKPKVHPHNKSSNPYLSTDLKTIGQINLSPFLEQYSYVKQISKPFDRTVMLIRNGVKLMVILRGPPGSGKSHLAQKLLVESGVDSLLHRNYIFSSDDYFVQNNVYFFVPNLLSEAHMWNQQNVRTAIKDDVSPIIVDNTNTEAWEMRIYAELAVSGGYDLEILEPTTRWFTRENELAKRNIHGVPKSKIRNMIDRYEKNITPNFLLQQFNLRYSLSNAPPQPAHNTKWRDKRGGQKNNKPNKKKEFSPQMVAQPNFGNMKGMFQSLSHGSPYLKKNLSVQSVPLFHNDNRNCVIASTENSTNNFEISAQSINLLHSKNGELDSVECFANENGPVALFENLLKSQDINDEDSLTVKSTDILEANQPTSEDCPLKDNLSPTQNTTKYMEECDSKHLWTHEKDTDVRLSRNTFDFMAEANKLLAALGKSTISHEESGNHMSDVTSCSLYKLPEVTENHQTVFLQAEKSTHVNKLKQICTDVAEQSESFEEKITVARELVNSIVVKAVDDTDNTKAKKPIEAAPIEGSECVLQYTTVSDTSILSEEIAHSYPLSPLMNSNAPLSEFNFVQEKPFNSKDHLKPTVYDNSKEEVSGQTNDIGLNFIQDNLITDFSEEYHKVVGINMVQSKQDKAQNKNLLDNSNTILLVSNNPEGTEERCALSKSVENLTAVEINLDNNNIFYPKENRICDSTGETTGKVTTCNATITDSQKDDSNVFGMMEEILNKVRPLCVNPLPKFCNTTFVQDINSFSSQGHIKEIDCKSSTVSDFELNSSPKNEIKEHNENNTLPVGITLVPSEQNKSQEKNLLDNCNIDLFSPNHKITNGECVPATITKSADEFDQDNCDIFCPKKNRTCGTEEVMHCSDTVMDCQNDFGVMKDILNSVSSTCKDSSLAYGNGLENDIKGPPKDFCFGNSETKEDQHESSSDNSFDGWGTEADWNIEDKKNTPNASSHPKPARNLTRQRFLSNIVSSFQPHDKESHTKVSSWDTVPNSIENWGNIETFLEAGAVKSEVAGLPQRSRLNNKKTIESSTNTNYLDLLLINDENPNGVKILSCNPRNISGDSYSKVKTSVSETLLLDKGTMTLGNVSDGIKSFDINQISSLFPKIPEKYILDVVEKCQGDIDWAVDLLLDSEHSIYPFDSEMESSSRINVGKEEVKCFTVSQAEMNKTPAHRKISPKRESKSLNTQEQVELKKNIENSVVIGKEYYSEKILKVLKKKRPEYVSLIENGFAQQEQLVDTVEPFEMNPQDNICIKGKEVSAYEDDERSSHSNSSSGCENDDNTLDLILNNDLILQLQQKFGNSNLPRSIDISPVVKLPVSLARQLYGYIMDSLQNNIDEQQSNESVIVEDEEIAKILQYQDYNSKGIPQLQELVDMEVALAVHRAEQEWNENSHDSVAEKLSNKTHLDKFPQDDPQLQEIMDMEVALAIHRAEQEEWKEKGHDTVAAKLSKNILLEKFPREDPKMLTEVLQAHDYSLHNTIASLTLALGMTQAEGAGQSTLTSKQDQPKETRGISILASELTEDATDAVSEAQLHRDQAADYHSLRMECLSKAHEAYRSGNKPVATYYSQLAELHKKKVEQCNLHAAACLLASHKSGNTLDLHFLHVMEAEVVLDMFLDEAITRIDERKKTHQRVYLITGRGLRSQGGISRIKPMVQRKLQARGIMFSEVNPGMLSASVRSSTPLSHAK